MTFSLSLDCVPILQLQAVCLSVRLYEETFPAH